MDETVQSREVPPAVLALAPCPHKAVILEDVKNRQEWNRKDDEILKRRLGVRKARKLKPYPGAPNSMVPIVDDATREKTDQEITMTRNAPLLAHFVSLSKDNDAAQVKQAERAFDGYLRYMVRIMPKLEEGMDTKNARGFGVFKTVRTEHPRFGLIPDVDVLDPKDLIVPFYVRSVQQSDRCTHVLRMTRADFLARAKASLWRHAETVWAAAKREGRSAGSEREADTLETTAQLIGLTTSGPNSKEIVVWEHYHLATAWDVAQDPTGQTLEGRRCVTVFSPDAPEYALTVYPWREPDRQEPLSPEDALLEAEAALNDGRDPQPYRTIIGRDRPWPFVQARFENRSQYYYDSRGIGQLCMDDQIAATALRNAKLTMMDYYQQPLLKASQGVRHSGNISFEPGSVLPEGLDFAAPPSVPNQFDFDIDAYKREAARRAGAAMQYEYSGAVNQTRKIQKTATEVQAEQQRTGMVSSASVDRFNDPLMELYQQLKDDLARLGRTIPIIYNNDVEGEAEAALFALPVLVVPASSAKTLNPENQFVQGQNALLFLMQFADKVPINIGDALLDVFASWDPIRAQKWIQPENGQTPLYWQVNAMAQTVARLEQVVLRLVKMAGVDVPESAIEGGDVTS